MNCINFKGISRTQKPVILRNDKCEICTKLIVFILYYDEKLGLKNHSLKLNK